VQSDWVTLARGPDHGAEVEVNVRTGAIWIADVIPPRAHGAVVQLVHRVWHHLPERLQVLPTIKEPPICS
jgi:hypothetical protein